jgi:hypothetical protein
LHHFGGPAFNNFILLQFGLTCPIYCRFRGFFLKANKSGLLPLPVTASERTKKNTTSLISLPTNSLRTDQNENTTSLLVFSLGSVRHPGLTDRLIYLSEGAHAIDKTILVNVNRNKYPVVRPTWALKTGLTDRLVVGRNVTLTLSSEPERGQELLSSEGTEDICICS